jgi:magnesium transporter
MDTNKSPVQPISLELYSFGENFFEKHHLNSTDQIKPFLESENKFWLNVCDLKNTKLLNEIAAIFDIHILAIEDIKNNQQRPKLEEFDHFVFLVAKMVYTKKDITALEIEQVSFVFGKNFVISFQENTYDIFDPIRVRLENPHGRMRKMGTDYFTYTLLDAIIDQYYVILEMMDSTIEEIEDEITNDSHKVKLSDVYLKRKALQEIKKIIWPTREMIAAWRKSESPLIKKRTAPFINDVYEHTVEIMENLEMQRESITTLVEIFMSNISLKQNEVMKTLTIIATIFIPLTFIAGVYGMNFEFMPELQWKYGYILIWSFFLISTLVMIRYFKKKHWF